MTTTDNRSPKMMIQDRIESVRRALAILTPDDEKQLRHRQRMFNLLDSARDPFSRDDFEPGHFTASAFVLSPNRASLLLIYSTKFQRWLQPGGHIDPSDDSIPQAAARETFEESGAHVLDTFAGLFDIDIHQIPANESKNEPAHEHFDLRFCFTASTTHHEPGSDARQSQWVPLDEITEQFTDASVMRAVKKIQKYHKDTKETQRSHR